MTEKRCTNDDEEPIEPVRIHATMEGNLEAVSLRPDMYTAALVVVALAALAIGLQAGVFLALFVMNTTAAAQAEHFEPPPPAAPCNCDPVVDVDAGNVTLATLRAGLGSGVNDFRVMAAVGRSVAERLSRIVDELDSGRRGLHVQLQTQGTVRLEPARRDQLPPALQPLIPQHPPPARAVELWTVPPCCSQPRLLRR